MNALLFYDPYVGIKQSILRKNLLDISFRSAKNQWNNDVPLGAKGCF